MSEIAERRKRAGFTQSEMAKILGISRAAYTNIENGKRNPSVKIAKKIGVILDMPWASIYDEPKKPNAV